MANILDYLDWRGDIPFSMDPFNEVDNLVLAQSAYLRLDGLISQSEKITPKEAVRRFFEKHTREEIAEFKSLHKDAPFLMEKLAESERFFGMTISNYVNTIDIDGMAQMSAMTIELPDFTYIAFRGTDDSLVGWKEDFNLSYMDETVGQKLSLDYLNEAMELSEGDVYVGGHSKGGNFSVYASAFCKDEYKERIKAVFSNDGPGFRKAVVESPEYNELLPKVVSILPESTLVGMLFSGKYDHKYIKSSLKGLAQHDATSWQVIRNRFVETDDMSPEGKAMDDAVATWLDELSVQDRILFTNVTFEILSASGATSLQDITMAKGGILELLRKSKEVPKERKKEFNNMLKRLFKLGGGAVLTSLGTNQN